MDDTIFELLSSQIKLHRDRGLQQMQSSIEQPFPLDDLEKQIDNKYELESQKWEEKFALSMSRLILLQSSAANNVSPTFLCRSKEIAITLLEDSEYRVRIAAGTTIK